MKHLIVLFASIFGYTILSLAQNLDSITPQLRDSMLMEISRITVQRYGPDYFRDYIKPEITRKIYPPNMIDAENTNRPYYLVSFFYDPEIEDVVFRWDFAYTVSVWADNAQPLTVMFANGIGQIVSPADGERIANLARKKVGLPTSKPDNFNYKLEPVKVMPYSPITDKETIERMRKYYIEAKYKKIEESKNKKNQ